MMLSRSLRNICFALAVLLAVHTSICRSNAQATAQPPSSSDDRGSLAWQARRAKEEGKTTIAITTPDQLWAQPEPLNDAIAHTTLTLARPIAIQVTHSEYEIVTWRKYHALERLSNQSTVRKDPLPECVPASLLPLGPDEFVVPELGGTADIDGVSITMKQPEVHISTSDKRHLMFLRFRASGALAVPNYGPYGLFSVDDSDNIHAWVDVDTNHLRSELLDQTKGKLSVTREFATQATVR